MPEFRFDPPLTLKGNIVVRNLDNAVRFMIGYREAHRPALQTSVRHRVEGAAGEAEERHAGHAFRGWAEAEGLIIKLSIIGGAMLHRPRSQWASGRIRLLLQ